MCCADFKFYLNRQGVRGAKGDKGDKGFSPSISLGKNTQEEFTLFITNEDETIETPNIKEGLVPEDRGGTYVRKDPETGLQYYGDANISTTDSVGEVQLASYDDLKNTELGDVEPEQQPAAGKAVEGLGAKEYFASKEDLSTVSSQVNKNTEDIAHNTQDIEDNAYNIQNLGNMTNTLETEVNSIKVNLNNAQGEIEALQTGKQNKLVEGDNITLTNNDDGTTTISSSGGGGGTGDVTAAGNNTFTGNNIFKGNSLNVGNDNEYSAVAEFDNVFYNPIDVNGVVDTVLQSKGGVTLGSSYSNNKLQSNTRQEYYSPTKRETYLSTIFNTGNLRFGNGLTVKRVESDYDASPAVIRDTYFEISTSGSQGSPLDEFIEGSTDTNTTTITAKDGKALKLNAPTIAIGDNLVNTTEPDRMQLYLKQGDIAAGDNITIEETATGIKVSASGGEAPTNMVTTDTRQDITGSKTFKNDTGMTIAQTSNLGNKVVISPYGTSNTLNNSLIGIREQSAHTWNIAAGFAASKFRIQNPITKVESGEGSASSSGDRPLLTVGKITAGDNITITDNGNTGITISATGGGSTSTSNNGIEGDYKVKHGIVDCPNGLVEFTPTSRDITIKNGIVLNCAGNGNAKTTIATAISHTLTSPASDITLFYAEGTILECGKVDWSETEPEDNGVGNYQAWFNPNKTANPDSQWQFKSNETGNVWRTVNSATPIVDMTLSTDGVTSARYIGYRILDDDVLVNKTETEFIGHQALPSDTYETLTLGASGATYTAPADGYVSILTKCTSATNSFFELANASGGYRALGWSQASTTVAVELFLLVKENDVFRTSYKNSFTTEGGHFRFYYAIGSEPTV